MKKHLLLVFLAVLAPALLWAQPTILLSGVEHTIDTLETFQCGPGSRYIALRMRRVSDGGGRLDAFLMQVDAANPYISFESVLGSGKLIGTEAVSKMGARKNLESDKRIFFGGTNGDFFMTTGDVGLPVGFSIVNNEFARIPGSQGDRRIGAVNEQMRGAIGSVAAFSGQVLVGGRTLPLDHINYKRGENQLVLFNRHNGTSTNTNDYGTELLLSLVEGDTWHTNCTVRGVVQAAEQNKGNMTIPAGQFVLSAHGTMAEPLNTVCVGDTLTVKLAFSIDGIEQNISQCVAGDNYALIVDGGKVVESNFWNETHPRTAFGQSQQGDTLIFCVVDGRALSVGCNTQALGAVMQRHGAYKALNWDGGGSSHLWLNNVGLMNAGCEPAERAVANGMFAVATLPEADTVISQLQGYSTTLRLPMYGVHKPKVLGYNRYGVLLNPDVQGVTLSCDSAVGYINGDGAFVCLGEGELRLAKGSAAGAVQIRIVDNSAIRMRLDTAVIYDHSDYAVEVLTTIGKNDILIQPSALTWAVADPTVASVTADGILNGLKDGITEVYGSLDGQIDTLVAKVRLPAANPLHFDDFVQDYAAHWTMKASNAKWNAAIAPDGQGKAVLSLSFTGGRQANIRLAASQCLYSAPEAFSLRLTPQGNLINKITIGLRANNAETVSLHSVENIVPDQPLDIHIPLDSLFGVAGDIAIHPVAIEFITLYFNTAAAQQDYHIPIDGIYLTYKSPATGIDALPVSGLPQNGKACKFVKDGQVYVMRQGGIYTILGTKIIQ